MRRAIIFAFVMPLLAGASWLMQNDEDVEKGQRAYQERNYLMATEHFRNALTGANDRSIVNFNLGTAYARQGEQATDESTKQQLFALAILTLREALTSRDPDHRHRVQYNLANVLVLARRYEEAIEAYKEVLQEKPEQQAAQHNIEVAEHLQKTEVSLTEHGFADVAQGQPIRAAKHPLAGPRNASAEAALEKLTALERGSITRIMQVPPAGLLSIPGYVPPKGHQKDVFLYAVCDKSSAWLGEQLTVSWMVFARSELLSYEPAPPGLAGWWSETLFEPRGGFRYSNVTIDGTSYVAALLSQRALFATRSGERRVEALRATIEILDGRLENIVSNDLHVAIKELPSPAPRGFEPSYVGEFRIQATVDRTGVGVGETPILRLLVEGQGALARTQAPLLGHPNLLFEVVPYVDEEFRMRGQLVGGWHGYEYWVSASAGVQRIPAIQLPFFNPATGRYEMAMTKPIDLEFE